MVLFVGRRQHFALVDVIDAERFQNARFGEVSDARLRHHRNRNGRHDFADLADRRHARHAAFFADVGRHAFERHHGDRARAFRDHGLFRVDDVHDDAAFQHLGEADLQPELFVLQKHVFSSPLE